MAIQAGQRYKATVHSACLTESVTKGTPGITIIFDTDDGSIEHTIYLTPKTVERASKDLVTLGADKSQLRAWTYLENIGMVIQGHECDITTISETYKGESRVRVQWINEPRKAGGGNLAGRVAQMFGGEAPRDERDDAPRPIDDFEVPF